MQLTDYPKYERYKNSGVSHIGNIPTNWELRKIKYCCAINAKSLPENTNPNQVLKYVDIGNVSLTEGIMSVEEFTFKDAPSRARRLAEQGDTILSTVRTYLKAISFLDEKFSDCVFSTGFAIIHPLPGSVSRRYIGNFLKSDAFTRQVDDSSKGISYPAINSTDLSNLWVVEPDSSEQERIAHFLDQKTAQIDQAVAIKEKQIALLKERKQILIQNAVTQGLNPNAPMKDSGIDWIGQIPAHWEVKRAKYLLTEIDDRSETGEEELLSVSHMTGVTPRSEKNVTMFMAEDYSGSKLCRSGDLVINIMWAWMGALGVSDRTGIVSPSYGVFRERYQNTFNPKYLEFLLKTTKYIEYYNKVSTGLHSSRLRFYGHMLFAMKIGFAPLDEQNEIVEYIDCQSQKIDQAIALQQQQIDKLKEYKTTLINSAVTGKIKVNS